MDSIVKNGDGPLNIIGKKAWRQALPDLSQKLNRAMKISDPVGMN